MVKYVYRTIKVHVVVSFCVAEAAQMKSAREIKEDLLIITSHSNVEILLKIEKQMKI